MPQAQLQSQQQSTEEAIYEDYPDVVNVPQMCEMLGGISTKTAYKILQGNHISHFRIGRAYKIPKRSIIHYLHTKLTHTTELHCDALVH